MNDDIFVIIFVLIILLAIFSGGGYLIGKYLLYRKNISLLCKSCGYSGAGIKGRNPTIAGTSLLLIFGMPICSIIFIHCPIILSRWFLGLCFYKEIFIWHWLASSRNSISCGLLYLWQNGNFRCLTHRFCCHHPNY